MELSFANGVQEYTVHGVKGDKTAFAVLTHCVLCCLSADFAGYCTLWRTYPGKRRVVQVMRSNALICAHLGAPSFRKARVRARPSWWRR